MAINFPNSPAVNDTFTAGGINFTFTGVKWESGAVVELSSDTTPTLGGNLDGGAKNIHNVGVITATGFSGPLTGNVTGNATGLTGDPSIQVTNATVLGNLDVQGTTSTIDTAITQVDSLNVEGSVGIGTTIDANIKLDVEGSLRAKAAAYVAPTSGVGLEIYYATDVLNDSPTAYISSYDRDATAYKKINYDASEHKFRASSTERLRILSDGKVRVPDNGKFTAGAGDDLEIYHDSTDNIIKSSTAALKIYSAGSNSYTVHISARPDKETIICYNNTNAPYVELYYDNSKKLETTATGVTVSGTVSDSIGPLRRLGSNIQTSNYTLVAADAGKMVRVDNGSTITIPDNVFSTGDMITIVSGSSSNVPITQGSGLSLYNASDGTTGNKTLAARTVCTILIASGGSSAKAYIAGGGLS
jgi:hypothetical protein